MPQRFTGTLILLAIFSIGQGSVLGQSAEILTHEDSLDNGHYDSVSNDYFIPSVISSFNIIYSQRILTNDFFGNLNTFESFQFNSPLTQIGLSFEGNIVANNKVCFPAYIEYSHILPQDIALENLSAKITGFNVEIGARGYDFFQHNSSFDLILFLGISTGRLRTYGTGYVEMKNPYFAPMAALLTKTKIGKMSIGVRASYFYDISKPGWRPPVFASKGNKIDLGYLRQSGINCTLSIGFTGNKKAL